MSERLTDADLVALTRDAAALPPGPYEVVQHGGGNCAVLAAGEGRTPGERIAFLSESWRRSPEEARGLADALAHLFTALASGIFARFAETIRQERAARRAAEVEVAKLRAELEVRRASDRRTTLFRARARSAAPTAASPRSTSRTASRTDSGATGISSATSTRSSAPWPWSPARRGATRATANTSS